jgi:hypothetical protein
MKSNQSTSRGTATLRKFHMRKEISTGFESIKLSLEDIAYLMQRQFSSVFSDPTRTINKN